MNNYFCTTHDPSTKSIRKHRDEWEFVCRSMKHEEQLLSGL